MLISAIADPFPLRNGGHEITQDSYWGRQGRELESKMVNEVHPQKMLDPPANQMCAHASPEGEGVPDVKEQAGLRDVISIA